VDPTDRVKAITTKETVDALGLDGIIASVEQITVEVQ
jgi:hypothetical protein